MLPVDHYGDYTINHIVYLLGENVSKYKNMSYGCDLLKSEIQNCRQEAVFIAFFNIKMTDLPLDHDGDHRMSQSYCFHVE